MARQPDEAPVTWGDLRRVMKAHNKKQEEAFGEVYEAIATGDSVQSDFWNEHEEKLDRERRAIKRLKDAFEGHTHEEDE